jgi:hypothetical protein
MESACDRRLNEIFVVTENQHVALSSRRPHYHRGLSIFYSSTLAHLPGAIPVKKLTSGQNATLETAPTVISGKINHIPDRWHTQFHQIPAARMRSV